ncbi:MAG: hypothetical protein LBM94_06955 [Propionibacteriaceae bacterium]|jgi:hypothetical protein|nr:hypothetical protein [Propionibacteriaceae bacterium]
MKAKFARALALIPLAALLTGCLTYETNVEIKDDSSIIVSISMGLEKAYADAMSVTDLCDLGESESPIGNGPGEPWTTKDTIGCKWSETLTLDAFNQGSSGRLAHGNGEYTFTMDGADMGAELSEMGASLDAITGFTFSVTFPGKVTANSGSGEVSGLGSNTVTWSKISDLTSGLSATGKDSASVTDSLLPILLIAGGVVIVAGIGIFVALKLKKSKAEKAAAAQQAAYYAQAGYQTVPSYAPQGAYGDPNAGYGIPPQQAPYGDPNAAYGAPQPQPQPQPPYVDPNAPVGYPATPAPAAQPPVAPPAEQYPPQAPYPPQS